MRESGFQKKNNAKLPMVKQSAIDVYDHSTPEKVFQLVSPFAINVQRKDIGRKHVEANPHNIGLNELTKFPVKILKEVPLKITPTFWVKS